MAQTLYHRLAVPDGHGGSSHDALLAVEVTALTLDHVLGQTVGAITTQTLLQISEQLGSLNLGFSVSTSSLLLRLDLFLQLSVLLLLQKLYAWLCRKLYFYIWSLRLSGFLPVL